MVLKLDSKCSDRTHTLTHSIEVTSLLDLEGGIGIAEMLFRSNILALVGGGTHPKFPDNKVFIWDDHQNKPIGELTFKSTVLAVRLRKDKLLIAIESKLYLYNLADLKLLNSWDLAIQNTKGLCVLSPTGDSILAYPDGKIGYFYIRNGGI